MKAIVEINGFQYPVEEQQLLLVNRLSAKEGDTLTFDKVLYYEDPTSGQEEYGTPYLAMVVQAKVERHFRHPKVTTRTYRRRQGYHRTYGHRQPATEISIEQIRPK